MYHFNRTFTQCCYNSRVSSETILFITLIGYKLKLTYIFTNSFILAIILIKRRNMKKISIALFTLFLLSLGTINHGLAQEQEDKAIKTLIETSYIHGAFNDLDPDAMRNGFHPEFAIFSAKGDSIQKYPIDAWATRIENWKNNPEFDPKLNKWEHKYEIVDITGGAAVVKVLLFNKNRHVYTDYLSLLKFESGWKIVGKVYHRHDYFKQDN